MILRHGVFGYDAMGLLAVLQKEIESLQEKQKEQTLHSIRWKFKKSSAVSEKQENLITREL